MGYDREIFKRVKDRYDEKRQLAVKTAEERRLMIHEQSPAIADIDRALAGTGLKLFRAACEGTDSLQERIAEMRRENEALRAKRASLLEMIGYSADYTEAHYECRQCNDSGYLDDASMCPCMKRALAIESFRASGLGDTIDRQTFDNFSLSYYKNDPDAYERMTENLQVLREYADTFTPKSANLLLTGGTGLGKTHLSTAVARTVIERGYSVLYDTAHNIFSDFNYDQFKSRPDEELRSEKYFSCDLLLLDDLGTEVQTKNTTSYFYNLVNTRMNRGKATIISTNLFFNELLSRYGDRIASRLMGEYRVLQFRGEDVRLSRLP